MQKRTIQLELLEGSNKKQSHLQTTMTVFKQNGIIHSCLKTLYSHAHNFVRCSKPGHSYTTILMTNYEVRNLNMSILLPYKFYNIG